MCGIYLSGVLCVVYISECYMWYINEWYVVCGIYIRVIYYVWYISEWYNYAVVEVSNALYCLYKTTQETV